MREFFAHDFPSKNASEIAPEITHRDRLGAGDYQTPRITTVKDMVPVAALRKAVYLTAENRTFSRLFFCLTQHQSQAQVFSFGRLCAIDVRAAGSAHRHHRGHVAGVNAHTARRRAAPPRSAQPAHHGSPKVALLVSATRPCGCAAYRITVFCGAAAETNTGEARLCRRLPRRRHLHHSSGI